MQTLRIGVITDIHAGSADSPDSFWQGPFSPAQGVAITREAMAKFAELAIDALFVLGDVTNDGDDRSLDEALAELNALSTPTWVVAGNHDLRLDSTALARATARAGGNPRVPNGSGEALGDGVIVAGLTYAGSPDEHVQLVEGADIASWNHALALLLSHFELYWRDAEAEAAGLKFVGGAIGTDAVVAALAERPFPTIVLHGHLHFADAVAHGATLQLGFPAVIEAGHEIAVIEIEHDDESTRLKITSLSMSNDGRSAARLGSPPGVWTFANGEWRPSSSA